MHHKRSYDAAGRLKQVEDALHDYTAQYDYAAGSFAKISGIAHHHGTTHSLQHFRSYDGYGRPVGYDSASQITAAPVDAHQYTLDALGRRIAHTLPDANTWHYGYNSAGEVSTAQLKDAVNTTVAQRDFAWDYDPD